MKVLQRLMVLACVSVLLASCGDDGGIAITLTSPADGTSYSGGDVISIAGTATDDIAVVNLTVDIPELTINQNVPGNGTASVPFSFTVDIVDGTAAVEEVNIKVTAIDDDGNSASEERKISIQ